MAHETIFLTAMSMDGTGEGGSRQCGEAAGGGGGLRCGGGRRWCMEEGHGCRRRSAKRSGMRCGGGVHVCIMATPSL